MKHILAIFFLLPFLGLSQSEYVVSNIPDDLKKDANSIVQKESVVIELISPKKMLITSEIALTVLNKNGNGHLSPYAHYDKSTKIKSIEGIVYDADGEEIEKFRRRDFIDLSAVDGGTLYSDNRVMAFNYDPSGYPYTVVFKHVIESSNTAHIQPFYPVRAYNSSVRESTYSIGWAAGISNTGKEKVSHCIQRFLSG
jgi:hypothetical protein